MSTTTTDNVGLNYEYKTLKEEAQCSKEQSGLGQDTQCLR